MDTASWNGVDLLITGVGLCLTFCFFLGAMVPDPHKRNSLRLDGITYLIDERIDVDGLIRRKKRRFAAEMSLVYEKHQADEEEDDNDNDDSSDGR